MSTTFFDIAISLDGFMAGDNRSPQNTIGDGDKELHNLMFVQKAFWEHLGKEEGQEEGPDGDLIRQTIARTGCGLFLFRSTGIHLYKIMTFFYL